MIKTIRWIWDGIVRNFFWVFICFISLVFAFAASFVSFVAGALLSLIGEAFLPVLSIALFLFFLSWGLFQTSFDASKNAEKEYNKVKPCLLWIPGFIMEIFDKIILKLTEWRDEELKSWRQKN